MRGGSAEEVPVTKVWILDIPISVDGKDTETALVRLGCVLRSSLVKGKIRNKDGKLTRVLTGRRFVSVNIPERPLERTVKIGGFTARLYHKEQPRADPQRATFSRCSERGHRLYHKEQPRADPQRATCSRCLERGHRLYHKEQPRADPQRATRSRCSERGRCLYHKEQPRADPQRATCSRCSERGRCLYHKEQPRADPQRATCSRCSERGHRLYHKEQPRADPQRGNVLQVLGERPSRPCMSKQYPMQREPSGGSQA